VRVFGDANLAVSRPRQMQVRRGPLMGFGKSRTGFCAQLREKLQGEATGSVQVRRGPLMGFGKSRTGFCAQLREAHERPAP